MSSSQPADSSGQENFLWEAQMPHDAPSPVFVEEKRGLRLYRGDALRLMKQARSEMFDMIFADPPYFLSNDGITCQAGKMVSVNKGIWDKATTFEAVHEFNREWLS